ncbi:unnamed protein product, partial [Heterotrigona itama]
HLFPISNLKRPSMSSVLMIDEFSVPGQPRCDLHINRNTSDLFISALRSSRGTRKVVESIAIENESGSLKGSFEENVSRVLEPRCKEQGDCRRQDCQEGESKETKLEIKITAKMQMKVSYLPTNFMDSQWHIWTLSFEEEEVWKIRKEDGKRERGRKERGEGRDEHQSKATTDTRKP